MSPSSQERTRVDETGFYASPLDEDPVLAWLDLLDSPQRPTWAEGSRRARVFLSADTAAAQGFITHGWTWASQPAPFACPQVVIEQGDLQLWLHYPDPDGDALLPDGIYQALERAGANTRPFVEEEVRRGTLTARALRALRGRDRTLPAFVDLTDEALSHTPIPLEG